ncbi:MAG TPA: DUF92 domain-containing protein [Anaerolineales bacterium]|nr:DUF92 domain-containing protein [Anaerolineales bacterium]
MADLMFPLQQLLTGAGLAMAMGLAGWAARSLSPSGAAAAFVVGTLIFGFGGISWAALLLTFFFTSSLLSKMFSAKKVSLAEKFEKGSRRDWAQVLANGGAGSFLAVVGLLFPQDSWPWLAFAGAVATVNADTWATELGVLSSKLPRLITTGKQVPTGTSGGISLAGTLATFSGGAAIGMVGWLFEPALPAGAFLAAVSLAGLTGSLVDSLLGATLQAIYYDPVRQKETERRVMDEDGRPASPVRGREWMNNDMVNFISSVCGALAAAGLWQLFT